MRKRKFYLHPTISIIRMETSAIMEPLSWTPDGDDTVLPIKPGNPEGGGDDPYGGSEEAKGGNSDWNYSWE